MNTTPAAVMSKRILVIEDGRSSSWLTRLATLPYDIEVARGSLDALRRLGQRAFDVLVTSSRTHLDDDLALHEEAQRLRPGVKAVLLAPSATPPDIIAALRAKVFGCLTEPFDPADVSEMVREAAEADNWRDGIQVLSARAEWIWLRVTCSLVTADRLTGFINALRGDVAETVRDELLIAFREVLLNAMEHGAGFDPEKVIDVSAVKTARAIVYYFRDPGRGFDTGSLIHAAVGNPIADPIAHLEYRAAQGLRPGGFGMLLVRQLVDSEAGNEVLLIKHLR
jgi:anti-sigma regulatory factor (Ser/Thr protein kinase)/CheY-like chemotaxis protein